MDKNEAKKERKKKKEKLDMHENLYLPDGFSLTKILRLRYVGKR